MFAITLNPTTLLSLFSMYINTDVVRYYLGQPGHDLDFLGHAMYQEETQEVETPQGVKSVLPSWVPNFSASLGIVPIPKILHVPEDLDRKGLTFYDKRSISSTNEARIAVYCPLGDAHRGLSSRRTRSSSAVCTSMFSKI